MHAATGTSPPRGGMTSHAAVVARGMGRPCVGRVAGVDRARGPHADDRRPRTQGRRCHHHRRCERAGHGGRSRHHRARAGGRFRHADGMGRQAPGCACAPMPRPRPKPHGAPVRRRGHRSVPHRAHVLRCRPHQRGARDDPRRYRGRPSRRARQAAAARTAQRLRDHLRGHGGPAVHDPPARPAAARVPAAWRHRVRGTGRGDRRRHREAASPRRRTARIQPDAGPSRLPAGDHLSRNLRDAGARDFRGRLPGGEGERRGAGARDHDPAGGDQARASNCSRMWSTTLWCRRSSPTRAPRSNISSGR